MPLSDVPATHPYACRFSDDRRIARLLAIVSNWSLLIMVAVAVTVGFFSYRQGRAAEKENTKQSLDDWVQLHAQCEQYHEAWLALTQVSGPERTRENEMITPPAWNFQLGDGLHPESQVPSMRDAVKWYKERLAKLYPDHPLLDAHWSRMHKAFLAEPDI